MIYIAAKDNLRGGGKERTGAKESKARARKSQKRKGGGGEGKGEEFWDRQRMLHYAHTHCACADQKPHSVFVASLACDVDWRAP